ncbi:hypothetical protein ACSSS7_006281 [Eimeria intestinalis]
MEGENSVVLMKCGASPCRWAPVRGLLAQVQAAHKPWLRWPETWEKLRDSEEQRLLREYLTSPEVQRDRLEETFSVSLEWRTRHLFRRQEAFFQYLVGVNEPDLLAAFFVYSGEVLLFTPRVPHDALSDEVHGLCTCCAASIRIADVQSSRRRRCKVSLLSPSMILLYLRSSLVAEFANAGANASILHYGHAGRPNDATIAEGDLLLYDMGGDFGGYATDITCTFPVSGSFTEAQREIYLAVLDAQQSVIKRCYFVDHLLNQAADDPVQAR